MVYITQLSDESKLYLRYLPVENRRDSLCRLQPHTGFVVVAGLAERLPVAFVPEKAFVAAMRDDVIHNRCGRERAVSSTFRAEWVRSEETPPRRLPLLVITTAGGGFPRVQRTMRFAINIIREVRASRMAAGAPGCMRHICTSQGRFSRLKRLIFCFPAAISEHYRPLWALFSPE